MVDLPSTPSLAHRQPVLANAWTPEWSNAVFSLDERGRRWATVRELMRRDGIDLLVCLPWTSYHDHGQADPRYLTQLGENSDETSVAFPVAGEVTAWHSRGGVWPSSNWLSDIRAAPRGSGGRTIVSWLRENGFERGTLAIAGLSGGQLSHCRTPHGEVNWQSVELIKQAVPGVTIVSATELLGEARSLKSDEEIDFLRHGAGIASAAIDALLEHAQAGVSEIEPWAEMVRAYARLGGSFEPVIGWITGPPGAPFARLEQPTGRNLQSGDLLTAEVEGRWGGYGARIDQTVSLGAAPPLVRDGMRMAIETLDRAADALRPGATVADIVRAGQRQALAGRAAASVTLRGCGTGDDGPVADGQSPPATMSLAIQANWVVSLQVQVTIDGRAHYGTCADSFVVRPAGAERLSRRPSTLHEAIHAG